MYTSDHDLDWDDPTADQGQATNATRNITRREKIQQDTGVLHWKGERDRVAKLRELQGVSCREYLYQLERRKAGFPLPQ